MALMKVRYVGLSDYRILTAKGLKDDHGIVVGDHQGVPKRVSDRINQDLRGVDVSPNSDLVWGPHNQHSLVLDVNEDLEAVLRGEGHFQLSSVADDGSEKVEAFATTSADNPSEVVATQEGKDGKTDTQRSQKK